jgi:spore protease
MMSPFGLRKSLVIYLSKYTIYGAELLIKTNMGAVMKTNETAGNIRTDLALENHEMLEDEIDGVEMLTEEDEEAGITVNWVKITNAMGAEAMGKPIGNYITLESASMKENDVEAHEEIMKVLARKLGQLYPLSEDATILVVGLGNWNVTPDALGPKVCAKILVTRHMGDAAPHDLKGHIRSVCALTPGVMGLTGIESGEIIKGVIEKVKPDVVVAIDALAARRTSRINATVQLSDTGINPGAGLGNRRMPLNEETMGVPVIAVGVPTVVDAATLVNDTMDRILETITKETPEGHPFYDMLRNLQEEEKYDFIKKMLDPYEGNMFVTPKEVDEVINRLARIVANALNMALHPGITTADVNRYLN